MPRPRSHSPHLHPPKKWLGWRVYGVIKIRRLNWLVCFLFTVTAMWVCKPSWRPAVFRSCCWHAAPLIPSPTSTWGCSSWPETTCTAQVRPQTWYTLCFLALRIVSPTQITFRVLKVLCECDPCKAACYIYTSSTGRFLLLIPLLEGMNNISIWFRIIWRNNYAYKDTFFQPSCINTEHYGINGILDIWMKY